MAALGIAFGPVTAAGADFQSARTLSLSQTGRGGALLADTILLNPSLLGFQPAFSLSGTWHWFSQDTQTAGDSGKKSFNVSVIDGKNEYVNAGIGFTRKSGTDLLHLGLAKRALPSLSFGVSVKRFSTDSSMGPAGQLIPSASGVDAGLSASVLIKNPITATPLQLGIATDNLVNKQSNEPIIGPRQVGVGLKANFTSILILYADAVRFFPHGAAEYTRYYGAAELALLGDFFLRGGMFGKDEKGWSTGVGWIGPRFGINYGYQNKLVGSQRSFQHAVGLDLFI